LFRNDEVGQKWKVANLTMNLDEMPYYMDFCTIYLRLGAEGVSDLGGGQYEKLVYLCNVSPPVVSRVTVTGACRRVSGLRGAALCGPDRAH
jgi:hypothetical protein